MTKRRLLLLTFTAVVVVAVTWLAMLPHRPGVTRANFDRVTEGMTFDQAKEILGDDHELCGLGRPWAFTEVWTGPDGEQALVTFRLDWPTNTLKVTNSEWRRFMDGQA